MNDVIFDPGEVIDDKYEIISKLGQGGMGVVYKARALALGRNVAVKMLTRVDEWTVKRFSVEGNGLARFKHPAVVRIDELESSEKWGPYLVLPWIDGRNLDVVARTALPFEEAVSLALGICNGVSACHIRSTIHGDLKPSNILVTGETSWLQRVKILDCGLAIAWGLRPGKAGPPAVHGVCRFIAPELLGGGAVTPQCDQYSIAALLYLLLTRRAPFNDLVGGELSSAILHGDYIAPRVLCPEIPVALEAAVARGLSLDPADRFANVDELALAILPFAPPNLRTAGARYFSNPEGNHGAGLAGAASAGAAPGKPLASAARRATPAYGAPLRGPASANGLVERTSDESASRRSLTPIVVQPLSDLPRARKPAPAGEKTDDDQAPPSPHSPHPPAAPSPSTHALPQMARARRYRHRSVWSDSGAIPTFISGAAFGALVATVIFVLFFLYRQQHGEPAGPAAAQPLMKAAPSGDHATR